MNEIFKIAQRVVSPLTIKFEPYDYGAKRSVQIFNKGKLIDKANVTTEFLRDETNWEQFLDLVIELCEVKFI